MLTDLCNEDAFVELIKSEEDLLIALSFSLVVISDSTFSYVEFRFYNLSFFVYGA